MRLTNDSYVVFLRVPSGAEKYYRDARGWVKVSTRKRKFRATAEQVLNHLLPALAGLKRGVSVEVKYRPKRRAKGASSRQARVSGRGVK